MVPTYGAAVWVGFSRTAPAAVVLRFDVVTYSARVVSSGPPFQLSANRIPPIPTPPPASHRTLQRASPARLRLPLTAIFARCTYELIFSGLVGVVWRSGSSRWLMCGMCCRDSGRSRGERQRSNRTRTWKIRRITPFLLPSCAGMGGGGETTETETETEVANK